MSTEEKKLTSSEIEEMLDEVKAEHVPIRTRNNNRKKKPKIRIDRIIAAIVVLCLIGGAIYGIVKWVSPKTDEKGNVITDNPLMDEKYPEISDVVKNYLNAFLIEDPEKRHNVLARYVGNMGTISEKDLKQNLYEIVDNYSEIECYTKEGEFDNTYVVFAYYQTEYKNISVPAPSISKFYVVRDVDTGNVYIQNNWSKEVTDYVNKVSQDQDVLDLIESVNKELTEVRAANPRLDDFMKKLENAKKAEETT